ncbi:hypothetical protein [Taibaiella koreensis]|uniref:hypothetical protein n=1 Tax=Taibaiella koreensis TaxID=1268548 RepID=UPI000E59A8A0|nr:hypothetical protein [Taibaiella koreensis]
MKTKLMTLLALLSLAVLQPAFAQKIKVKEGSLDALKGVSKLNLTFDYSDMSVGKFKTEAEYIDKKKGDYNKKEAGKGDQWEKDWIADRTGRYAPQFTELFNKNSDNIKVGDYASEKYTMVVKTTKTEPGFNIAITRKNAEIEGEILITETGNPSHVVLRLSFEKALGRSFGGYDYDTGFRIQEAYADLGKALGRYMSK